VWPGAVGAPVLLRVPGDASKKERAAVPFAALVFPAHAVLVFIDALRLNARAVLTLPVFAALLARCPFEAGVAVELAADQDPGAVADAFACNALVHALRGAHARRAGEARVARDHLAPLETGVAVVPPAFAKACALAPALALGRAFVVAAALANAIDAGLAVVARRVVTPLQARVIVVEICAHHQPVLGRVGAVDGPERRAFVNTSPGAADTLEADLALFAEDPAVPTVVRVVVEVRTDIVALSQARADILVAADCEPYNHGDSE